MIQKYFLIGHLRMLTRHFVKYFTYKKRITAVLQFSGILINLSVRHTPRVPLWFATQQLVVAHSTISNPVQDLDSIKSSNETRIEKKPKRQQDAHSKKEKLNVRNLFEGGNRKEIVENLLSSTDLSKITPENSLKIISKLSDLVNKGIVQITDFNSDERYKVLCKNISLSSTKEFVKERKTESVENEIQNSKQKLYTRKLGFFYDMNEIQKIAENPNMSIIEATKIMSKLAFHKSRVIPLLQSLAHHIVQSNREINIKLASDILYNMAVLNFHDEVLIDKIASSLVTQIPKTDKKYCAAIGSILKSIGLLRYRNEKVLMQLTTWMLENSGFTRPQDICSFLVTLAVLNYNTMIDSDVFQKFIQNLKESDMSEANEWLDVVWALVVLNKAHETQVLSVLNSQFLTRLSALSPLTELKKRKLLNINAAANLIFKNDTGQFIEQNPSIMDVTLERSKEHQEFVKGVLTALHALLPSTGCLKTNVNMGMGFSIDAEFYVDKKCNPILNSQIESKENETLRLAVVCLSYYDFCRGEEKMTGSALFQCQLLKLAGFQVIPVSYEELQSDRKVVERVIYLKNKIQVAVRECSDD